MQLKEKKEAKSKQEGGKDDDFLDEVLGLTSEDAEDAAGKEDDDEGEGTEVADKVLERS